jgi:hypothetical protein
MQCRLCYEAEKSTVGALDLFCMGWGRKNLTKDAGKEVDMWLK